MVCQFPDCDTILRNGNKHFCSLHTKRLIQNNVEYKNRGFYILTDNIRDKKIVRRKVSKNAVKALKEINED